MSLFGSSASGGRSSSKNLVEFRAGKMTLKGTTVTADKRKGLVYVQQSDDALTHFCWKDRTTGKVEDDLIIFPDDCEFKRVPQCTTGRVYILKFKTSSRKFFFWMQEPKTEKDDEYCKKVNDSLNNPQASGQSSGGSLGGMDQLGHGNLQELFANMDQEQIMQLMASGGLGGGLGGLGNILSGGGGRQSSRTSNRSQTSSSSTRSTSRPSATTTTTAAAPATERASVTPAPTVVTPAPVVPAATPAATDAAGTPGLQLSQLQNILSQMGVQPGTLPDSEPVDLSKAITPDVMIPILANAEVQERLKPYLPQGESIPSTAEELRATVKSAQFRQAMGSFSEALATGQLGPVLKQFGLPVSAQEAAAKGDVEGFAKAMQESEAKSGDKKSDKEEDMVVDQ